ncbi:MAG: phosphomannomutase [Euryarchaeota archaeon]|nr:phosphomannomutase [Euryarchaeota archaeon]
MSLYVKEIRGIVNSEITNEFASNLGNVIGNFVSPEKVVVVGRDMNPASQMVKRSITSGIMAAGIDVFDFGVAPIPAIHYGMSLYDSNVMITVTASHMRPEDITIKIFSDHEIHLEKHAEKVLWSDVGALSYVHDYVEKYVNAVVDNIDSDLISSKASKIVLDAAQGLNVLITPEILSQLKCETILLGRRSTDIEGKLAEPNPENISLLSNLVASVGADMGIALDNDRDRVIFIDEKGNILRDQTALGIFTKDALEESPEGTIVSSVVASMSLDEIVSEYKGKLIKTPVDLVLNGIIEKNAIFGGDEPGMYVFPKFNQCFDAIYASVKMLEIICKKNNPLSKLAEEIPEYPRTVFIIECEHDEKMNLIEKLKEHLKEEGELNTMDGIRVDFEDSFVLVRPSRFEPLLRVYVEAKSSENLQKLSHKIRKIIEES